MPAPLTGVLEQIRNDPSDGSITVVEILDAFGARTYGPLLLAPAIIAVLPIIGALPGVSIATALLTLIVAAQMLIGRQKIWAPKGFLQLKLPRSAVRRAAAGLEPAAHRIERIMRPRLRFLARAPWIHLVGANAVLIALAMTIGALAPGAIVPPALAMIVLALGLTTQDGVVIFASGLLAGGAGWAMWEIFASGS